MNRRASFALLASGLIQCSAAAQVDVAPAPRAKFDRTASRDPVPAAASAKKENPLEVVERIIKNSNAVGDKLAKTDTGSRDARQTGDDPQGHQVPDRSAGRPAAAEARPEARTTRSKDDQNKKDDKADKGDMNDKQDMPPMPMGKGMGDKGDNGRQGWTMSRWAAGRAGRAARSRREPANGQPTGARRATSSNRSR